MEIGGNLVGRAFWGPAYWIVPQLLEHQGWQSDILITKGRTWRKHRKKCECCPVSLLIVREQRLSRIQVLNCQKCNQCLKCHKSLGSLFEGALNVFVFVVVFVFVFVFVTLITLIKCLKVHKSLGSLFEGAL